MPDKREAIGTILDSARERILDAALEAFADSGFNGATTKDIAKKAAVNEVTIFRQFRSKRALFNAVMVERSPLVQAEKVVSLDPRTPVEQQLVQNLRSVLGVLRANKQLFMVALGDAWRQPKTKTTSTNMIIQKGIDFVSAFMQSLMDAGKIRRTDPRIAARMIMGAMQAYFITTDLLEIGKLSQAEEERILRGFVDIFLNGMKTEHRGDSG